MDNTRIALPSDRRFGLTFACLFALLGAYSLYRNGPVLASLAWFCIGIVLGLLAMVAERALHPLNRAWFFLGQVLGKIMNPIVLGTIFFGLLTPVALVTRQFGRDELRLNRRSTTSYWISRTPPGPGADSFTHQF